MAGQLCLSRCYNATVNAEPNFSLMVEQFEIFEGQVFHPRWLYLGPTVLKKEAELRVFTAKYPPCCREVGSETTKPSY